MGAPKWQEPLVVKAAQAERTLLAVMHAPGGGAGAMAAAAAADQDLAELCRAVAARSGSPLLRQLLMHGARALDAHAGVLLAATIDPDELVVPAAPVESEPVDEDQALVDPTPEPVVTSGDAQTNEPEPGSAQASLDDDRPAIAQALAEASGGTVVHCGEVYEPAAEQPPARLDGGWPTVEQALGAYGIAPDEFSSEDVRTALALWEAIRPQFDPNDAWELTEICPLLRTFLTVLTKRRLELDTGLFAAGDAVDAARADPNAGAR